MTHAHIKVICKGCDKTINQCRCITKGKTIQYDLCEECFIKKNEEADAILIAQKKKKSRRVVCAAVKFGSVVLVAPRHGSTRIYEQLNGYYTDEEQLAIRQSHKEFPDGFIDNYDNFMDRYEALKVARDAGQILYTGPGYMAEDGDELFSENLY